MVVDSPPGMTRASTASSSRCAADRHGVRAHGLEGVHVLAHVSLQGEDSDGHGHDGRF